MQRKIILGPPGTGKTTTLLDLVDKHLERGDKPEQIGFISFTKKAVTEARDRAVERFKLGPRRFPYFRTIHSLAFRQCGIAKVEVMGWKDYKALGQSLGMKIEGIRRQDRMSYEMEKGELAIFLESLSRLTCRSLKETWSSANVEISWEQLDLVARTLDKYKKGNFVLDFTDMLVRYMAEGSVPILKALFVDESQDLCQLQWRIIEKLSTKAEIVYIAGDDDQAIFRWSGADLDYFHNLEGDKQILKQSYRVPRTIHTLSQALIKRVSHRYDKDFAPCERKGSVNYHSDLEQVDMSEGSWLVLVRNGYQARDIIKHCRYEGLYYDALGDSPEDNEPLQAVISYEHMRKNRSSLTKEKESLVKLYMSDDKYETLSMYRYQDLPIWHEGLDRLSPADRDYFIACLKRKEKLKQKPRVRITTIHGAKGGEADNVVLLSDISKRTWASMQENPDDEVRVFYVGATRAIENLHIIEPQTRSYFTI